VIGSQGIINISMKKWLVLTGLFILVIVGLIGYKTINKPKPVKTVTKKAVPAPAASTATQQPEVQLDTAEIHGLVNQERAKAKLKALSVNDDLYDSAKAKCEDMKKNNYFTHTSPKGTDFNTFIKQHVPKAKLTGENLGAGYTDVNALIKDWMQSPKHKENILNPKFTAEAIASCGKSTEKPGIIIVAHYIQL
jgi:uncharacterized protein YkwD